MEGKINTLQISSIHKLVLIKYEKKKVYLKMRNLMKTNLSRKKNDKECYHDSNLPGGCHLTGGLRKTGKMKRRFDVYIHFKSMKFRSIPELDRFCENNSETSNIECIDCKALK